MGDPQRLRNISRPRFSMFGNQIRNGLHVVLRALLRVGLTRDPLNIRRTPAPTPGFV